MTTRVASPMTSITGAGCWMACSAPPRPVLVLLLWSRSAMQSIVVIIICFRSVS